MSDAINLVYLKRETQEQKDVISTLMRDVNSYSSVISDLQERIEELENELKLAQAKIAKYEAKFEGRA